MNSRALLLIDIQNDFLPGGALAVTEGDRVVDVANRLQPHFETVIATQDWHPENHGSFAANHPGNNVGDVILLAGVPQRLWPTHCVQGSRGADFPDTLERGRWSAIIPKGTQPQIDSYSGFFDNGGRQSTGLERYLREHGIGELVVLGLATDYCVKATVLDACRLGFRVTVITDGCRAVNVSATDGEQAFVEMTGAGATLMTSGDFLRGISDDLDVTLCSGRFLQFVRRGHWEFAQRRKASGVVCVAALTESGNVLLVEQYRPSVKQRMIELPAGLVGDEAENSAENSLTAARRELLEETGYEAEHWRSCQIAVSSAGMTDERIEFYVAWGARRVTTKLGVGDEDITLHEIPLRDIDSFLDQKFREGVAADARLLTGIRFLERIAS